MNSEPYKVTYNLSDDINRSQSRSNELQQSLEVISIQLSFIFVGLEWGGIALAVKE